MRERFVPKLLILAGRDFQKDNCTLMAASIAYYVLFSMFPLLILSVGLLGYLLEAESFQDRILNLIVEYIPGKNIGDEDLLMKEIRIAAQSGGKTFGVIGLLGLIWSGSNMFGVIRQSINLTFNITSGRRFYRKKLLDFAMMLLTGLLFLISVLGTAFIQGIDALTVYIPYFGSAIRSLSWKIGGFVIPGLISMIAFLLIYRIYPATKIQFKEIWPGAVAAALLFEFGKEAFGFYLKNFGKYEVVFGSLGAIVSFLLWVYISAAILLFGAEVSSEYGRACARSVPKRD